jgi:4-cresol dehydrogenase (hydroxylating)
MAILPPGLTRDSFAAALNEFRAAVGDGGMFTSDEDVALYRDAYSPLWGEADERLVSAAVAPTSVEQVQQVVRTANKYKVPIYPISTGKNLGYGGSAPILSGSVVIDLKRMNRVLEVDDKRGFALVEPGVAYFDLYRYIRERGLKVWIDCPDPGWGSLIGNSLDHGVGYTWGAFRDHFGSHCGMEVVLPNGELMRTGMGALPNSKTWQDYRYGFGPYVDGLFSQGNFGIVTKMGFWLMPEPEAYRSGYVSVPRRRDLIPLVDNVNYLEHSGLIGQPQYSCPLTGGGFYGGPPNPALAALVSKPGGATDEELDKYAQDNKKASWRVELQFYGPANTVDSNWEFAKARMAAAIPGATFDDGHSYRFPLTDEQVKAVEHKVAIGVPNLAIFAGGVRSELNPSPRDGHCYFAPVIPKTGEGIFEAQKVLGDAYRKLGMPMTGPFTLPQTWIYRSFVMLAGFPISRSDKAANKRTREVFAQVLQVAREHGWAEYRSPPAFADMVMDCYSFNDNILRKFSEHLKDAVDPNGIIAAGRGGIWPKHIRDGRRS